MSCKHASKILKRHMDTPVSSMFFFFFFEAKSTRKLQLKNDAGFKAMAMRACVGIE